MNIEVVFDHVEAAKQCVFTVGDANTLITKIEGFMKAHGLDCGKVAELESDIAAMLYEIAHDPDTEYSYVTMYINEDTYQNTNFGSFFYLNSADTLLNYSKNQTESFAPNFYFMIPNFVMVACYFDSYLNSVFSEIKNHQVLDFSDVTGKGDSIDKKFDSKNLCGKFKYLEKKLFHDYLYLKPFCLAEVREQYFNTRSRDCSRPMYPDTLLFRDLMSAIVLDRNAIAHPKNTFTQRNLSDGLPDLFPNTAAHLNIEAQDISQKNLMVLDAIHKKIANFQSFFEIGMIAIINESLKKKKHPLKHTLIDK